MAIYVKNKEGVMESYKIVGLKGENGVTPDIQIGTVTTLEPGQQATVTKEGTNERPIFNFGIPKGADGTGGDSNDGASIDDSTISTKKTWSSSKIENFVLTNNNTIWKDVNGENLSIEHTKEGYLRGVEILGNTIQDQDDLSDIKHLGELYVDDDGKPKLDSQGRKQYKIEVMSFNGNLGEYELEVGALDYNTGLNIDNNTKFRTKDFIKLDNLLINSYQNITNTYGYVSYYTYVFYNKDKRYIGWKNITQLKRNEIPLDAEYFKFFTLSHDGVLDEKTFQSNVWYSKKLNESYSEPKSFKTTILTPCQLMKVGDVSDRLYWDSNKGRYVVEKKVEYILPATLNITKFETRENSNKIVIYDAIPRSYNDNNYFTNRRVQYLNYVRNDWAGNDILGGVSTSWEGYIYLSPAIKYSTQEEAQSWLNTLSDIKIGFIRNNARLIETNITEELKLPTYINSTYISVSGGIQGSIKAKAPVDGGKVIKTLQRENIELKATNDTQDGLINTTMLATDEMFMMLEPLLAEVVNLNGRDSGGSPIMNMYVAMIQRGIKTIESVPVSIRDCVADILSNKDGKQDIT